MVRHTQRAAARRRPARDARRCGRPAAAAAARSRGRVRASAPRGARYAARAAADAVVCVAGWDPHRTARARSFAGLLAHTRTAAGEMRAGCALGRLGGLALAAAAGALFMAGAAPSLADGEQPLVAGGVHAGNRWRLPPRGCDPADVMTPAAVEHSVRALIDAEEMFSPFEHLYVTEIFHPDVYACMMHLMPPPEAYSRSHHLSNLHEDNDEIPVRYQTRIRQPGRIGPKSVKVARDYMNSTAQAFWAAWEEHYGSHSDFSRALMERFRGALEARTPAFLDEVEFVSTDFFQWDQPGTAFEPHSELRDQWVTFIFFLPVDHTHDDMATKLLAPRDKDLAWLRSEQASDTHHGSVHPPLKVFYPIDAYPQGLFIPNSMVSFVPCKDSWHAVLPASGERHSISGCIGTEPTNDVPKVMCRRRPDVRQLARERDTRLRWFEEWRTARGADSRSWSR